ncbi:hypothetical protein, partial [Enterococcus faecium]|uniref:hypothetical protein n=1 Tax=Enterococcus faecium TaxID=1352 RepID=UPI003AAEE2B2
PSPNQATANRINASINSFTQIGIADLDNQIAGVKSQTAIKLAEAQQKARTVTASKTQAKSVEMLQIELEAAAIETWNGHLSPVQPQPGQTIVLGGNDLAGALNKPSKQKEGGN